MICLEENEEKFGESYQIELLAEFLKLPNQNDRQCAVNDMIDLGEIGLLPLILKTPVAPSFRLRAINKIWPQNLDNVNGLSLFLLVDTLIQDNPNELNLLDDNQRALDNKLLIDNLFSTDFRTCYIALKDLIKRDPNQIWLIIESQLERIKRDYGALYFLMVLFRSISGWEKSALKEIKAITILCLGSQWPDFIKFKPVAILTLMKLFPKTAIEYVPKWLDESLTPFWACRYAALLAIEKSMERDISFLHEIVLDSMEDSHCFVRRKSVQIQSGISK